MKLLCACLLLVCCSVSAKMDIMRNLLLVENPEIYGEDQDLFEMTGEFGLLVSGGNFSSTSLTSKINAKHNTERFASRYVANILYAKAKQDVQGDMETITSAQRLFFSAQTDYKLSDPSNRLFVYAEYEDDRFSSFRYQASLAVGWSEQIWSTPSSELRYSIGPGYSVSKLKPEIQGVEQMGMIMRAAVEYEKKINSGATFRQFFSTEADDEFSRSVSETSIAAKINGSLAMKVSVNMIHNSQPQQIDESLDTQTSVTLVYQFF